MFEWRLVLDQLGGSLTRGSFVRDFFWYGGVNGLQALIPLCLLPFITRTVSSEQYGLYGFFIAVVLLFHPFVRLGMDSSVLYKTFTSSSERLSEYWGTALTLCFLVGGVLAMVAWFFPILSSWGIRGLSEQGVGMGVLQRWLPLVIMIALFENVLAILRAFSIAISKRIYYAVLTLGQRLLWALLAIWLVVLGGEQAGGLLLSQVYSLLLLVLLGLVWLWRMGYLKLAIKSEDILHSFRYGLPLVLQVFSFNMIQYSDRFFLKVISGLDSLGVYVAGTQVSLAFFVFTASLQSIWHPWVFARLASDSYDRLLRIKRALLLLCPILLLLAIAASVVLIPLTRLLTTGVFSQAVVVVPWLVFAHAAQGFYLIFSVFLLYQGRTLLAAIIAFSAFCCNLALNYPFIVERGIVGAAQATLLANLVSAGLCILFVRDWNTKISPAS